MGNPFLLQACLRLNTEEIPKELELGREYTFSKEGHRLYQIKVPMDLRTTDWEFIARVIVTKYSLGDNKTEGIYIPVKLFSAEERKIITKTYVSDEEVRSVLERLVE
ncbi:MAG: DUF2584 family protein [Nanoarchaeota archaeon]